MKRTNRFIFLLLPLILLSLFYGVYELLNLRLEQGDVYPPYSSFRADPLGAKAYYESLQEMKGLSVSRNFEPADKIQSVRQTTLFDLGDLLEEVLDVPVAEVPDVESYLLQGGRMVITLVGENDKARPFRRRWFQTTPTITPTGSVTPTVTGTPSPSSTPGVKPAGPKAPPPSAKNGPRKAPSLHPTRTPLPGVTFGKVWGVQADAEPLPKSKSEVLEQVTSHYSSVTVERVSGEGLPAKLPWHSAIYFKKLDPAWKVLYQRGTKPVAIERMVGKGTLVLLSDSYLVSNEALLNDRHADLLSYLAGNRTRVLFDETHLGVGGGENVATLTRKYGLGGFVLGLLILALLFIWRYSSSLVPPPTEESMGRLGQRSGKDASTGLVNLLRRNIPGGAILSVAFDRWKKTFAGSRGHLRSKVTEMESELSRYHLEKGIHPVEEYLRLSKIFKKKK